MQGDAFHVPDAGLSFEPAELSFETETDTGREGVIRVRHRAGRPARGYVYPSERCMRGVREQFAPAADGNSMIRWQFDARGLAPGRTVRGFFRVISPYGEYRIPYTVEVSGKGELVRKRAGESDPGKTAGVKSLADFRELAAADPGLAASFFYSSRFADILEREEDRTLYRGLSMQEGNLQNVEEFLITACGKEKTLFEPVDKILFLQTQAKAGRTQTHLAGSRAERALEAHRQRVRRSGLAGGGSGQAAAARTEEDLVFLPLRIRQTGAGSTGPVIRTEGQFLPAMPEEARAGSGSAEAVPDPGILPGAGPAEAGSPQEKILTVQIPVSRPALHAGRNFGRVIVRGPFNEFEVPVEVHCPGTGTRIRRRQEKELDLLQLQLMRMYVDLRLEDRRPEDWFQQADRLIDEISLRSHRDLVPRLYGVHLLILRGQYPEAQRELGRIEVRYGGSDAARNSSARFTGEREGAFCYRQYLTARCRMEDVRLRTRVVRFLHGVYRQTGDWRTAWMLLDLADEYAPGTAARWNFLRRQYENGCNSPVIWIEAWEMVRGDPQILLPGSSVQERWARDDFGLHVLWYAARNNVLTPKAAEVMVTLAEKKKTFSGVLFKGLCAAWEMGRATDGAGAGSGREETQKELLRAICIQLVRGQDLSPAAHRWYTLALEAGVSVTRLEESWQQSMPADDARYRLPAGRNAVLRTTASRIVRAVIVYDRFRGEDSYPVRGGLAFLPVFGTANTVFLEDAEGNRYAGSLPYALDVQEEPENTDPADPREGSRRNMAKTGDRDTGHMELRQLAARIGFGDRDGLEADLSAAGSTSGETGEAALRLLDCGELTAAARTQLLLYCLDRSGDDPALLQAFLKRVDPAQCSAQERPRLLQYLADAGACETAMRWLMTYGDAGVSAELLGRIALGLSWEGGMQTTVIPAGWEAFLRGNRETGLLERLAASFCGLSGELLQLRRACADRGVPTGDLDSRLIRQALFSGAMTQDHAGVILGAGKKLGEAFPAAVARYADYSFSEGLSMGNRMTDLIAGMIADSAQAAESGKETGIADICRIACLKELSMRQEEITERERAAAKASLSALLSRGIIFPFFRQFPGLDDRLDLYAEETLVQYHPARPCESGGHIVFHYTTSRRGEAGSYRARPMKEMYRDFYVSGFLLFYGEQMHYYITDDEAQKNVVQSGMIGQDARILETCSGRFGLINETTRAAALREYDEALSLLTGYYRRSYLESELFRR